MKKFIVNKKGTDKVLSIYWFAILLLVVGGVVIMTSSFYGHPYDVREIETGILANSVADCISDDGVLIKEIFTEGFKEDFLNECGLVFKENEYYVEVDFYNLSNTDEELFEISEGNANFKADCSIEEDYKRFAKCNKERMYSTLENKQYLIEITSIVGKVEKNVK